MMNATLGAWTHIGKHAPKTRYVLGVMAEKIVSVYKIRLGHDGKPVFSEVLPEGKKFVRVTFEGTPDADYWSALTVRSVRDERDLNCAARLTSFGRRQNTKFLP